MILEEDSSVIGVRLHKGRVLSSLLTVLSAPRTVPDVQDAE